MDDGAHDQRGVPRSGCAVPPRSRRRRRQPGGARHHGRAAHLDRGLRPDRRRPAERLVAGRGPAARRAPRDRGVGARPRPGDRPPAGARAHHRLLRRDLPRSTDPPPRRRADHGRTPSAQAARPRAADAVQEARAERQEAAAGEGADHRGPARDREAAYAEGRLRLHRGRRRGRDLARPRPTGVRGHRVPPVDPARRLAGGHVPRGARRPGARCRSASRRPASPG